MLWVAVTRISNSLKIHPPVDPRSCDQGAFNRDDKLFKLIQIHSFFYLYGCNIFTSMGDRLHWILFSSAPFLSIHLCIVPSVVRGLSSLLFCGVSVSVRGPVPCHAANQQLLAFSDQSREFENEKWSFHSSRPHWMVVLHATLTWHLRLTVSWPYSGWQAKSWCDTRVRECILLHLQEANLTDINPTHIMTFY